MPKLSDGFAGSTTRSLDDVTQEVETRMAKRRMSVSESVPGQDYSKPGQKEGYGKPHDDSSAEAPPGFTLAAAGNARDQEQLDYEDEIMQREQGGIKPASEQFPGKPSVDELIEKRMRKLSASDNAAYDKHQTDPARLSAGVVHCEEYKGRQIHVIESGPSYAMAIDRVKQPGNFPGVATAVQRGRILIDRQSV